MTDIVDDIRPVTELLNSLRTQGVRADNRDRLKRQLADVQAAIKRFAESFDRLDQAQRERETHHQALGSVREQLRFAREAREFLEESIVATETFVSMLVRDDVERTQDERLDQTRPVLRARPLAEPINYGELSREHIARYPKIRARLAE